MLRWCLTASLIVSGIAAAVYPATRAESTTEAMDRSAARERERARFMALAGAMNLTWRADSNNPMGGRKLILSDLPVSFERSVRLNINYPNFERWQGTVAVYLGEAHMWRANHDPQYPQRSAVLGESFVYGDPELIERLRSAQP